MESGMVLFWAIVVCVFKKAVGNGYMVDPPARSSMWRLGYDTPKNYNDMSINCGGSHRQHVLNGGVCGVCGDPADEVPEQEAGGRYATGFITRTYKQGGIIPIRVNLTSAHGGWFEFRMCANNDVSKAASRECFEMNLLKLVDDPAKTRYTEVPLGGTAAKTTILMEYRLPAGLRCSHCVLQWLYNTGKDWGCDEQNVCAVGKGNQEQFVGCSDVAITLTGEPNDNNNNGGTGSGTTPSHGGSGTTSKPGGNNNGGSGTTSKTGGNNNGGSGTTSKTGGNNNGGSGTTSKTGGNNNGGSGTTSKSGGNNNGGSDTTSKTGGNNNGGSGTTSKSGGNNNGGSGTTSKSDGNNNGGSGTTSKSDGNNNGGSGTTSKSGGNNNGGMTTVITAQPPPPIAMTTVTNPPTTTRGPPVPLGDCQAKGVLKGRFDKFCQDQCIAPISCPGAFCNEKCHERARQLQ